MLVVFLGGLVLGFALILPIGAQNLFVVGQGLAVGLPRVLWAVVAAACCDTLLIIAGAAGMSGLITSVPAARTVLLLAGALFLAYLGIRALRSDGGQFDDEVPSGQSVQRTVISTVSVSLLNPHAILDTVGVIGTAVLTQPTGARFVFAAGAISASWIWFIVLGVGAAALRRYLNTRAAMWFDRISGLIMLTFAVIFAVEFVRTVTS